MNQQLRVLAVDDDKLIRMNLALALGREGFLVDAVATCDEARALLRENQYEVVLTDLDLCHESGLDITRMAHALAPAAKVIVLTGSTTGMELAENGIDGVQAVVMKPFALCDLLEAVKLAVGASTHEGAG